MSRRRQGRTGRRVPKYLRPGPPEPTYVAPGLPTERELSVFDSLDELHAVKNFLGKDLEQAQALFCENFLYYQEDLLFMGPKAFRFYVASAINYLLSEAANDDSDAVSTFCMIIEHRLEYEPVEIAPVGSIIREAILGILKDFDRYGCSEIYGDLAERYRVLLSRLDPCPRET